MNRRICVLAALLLGLTGCSQTQTRAQAADEVEKDDLKFEKLIGDVTEVGNLTPTAVSGVGLVEGLDNTGGGVPQGEFRKMLEDQLHKAGVTNAQELLASTKYTMVLIGAKIPPGTRKGDKLDLEVQLPPQSKATSLRGGYLLECPLKNTEILHDRLTMGHVLADAHGPLLVGFGEGAEDVKLQRGRIWEGGTSHIDAPFYLYLNNDQKFAKVANAVANRINAAFPDDAQKQALVKQIKGVIVQDQVASGINGRFHAPNGLGRGEAAQAMGKEIVYVNVPVEYRLNPERFIRVIRLIPLGDTAECAGRYRSRLHDMLLEPKDTVRAALRLEALGKESIPALKKGLSSHEPLVRFASAESLAYLGSSAGVEELGRLADRHETLRAHCLNAMAGLDEASAQAKLVELMKSSNPEMRIGAFRALLVMNETSPRNSANAEIRGQEINEAFWLHRVAPLSSPLVHISTNRRSEIVIFGETPTLKAPFTISVGEFVIAAAAGDSQCKVTRFEITPTGRPRPKMCSCKVEDVVRTIAELGGQYPDAVDFLRTAERNKMLTCAVAVNALPSATPVELLAACGSDAGLFKDNPELQQEVRAAQEDLGMTNHGASAGAGQR